MDEEHHCKPWVGGGGRFGGCGMLEWVGGESIWEMVVCDRGSRMSVLFGLRVGRMVGILTGVEVGLVEAV